MAEETPGIPAGSSNVAGQKAPAGQKDSAVQKDPAGDVSTGTRQNHGYRAVLFDCDGTLLNTIYDLAYAGNTICERHGWPTHSVEEFQRMVGNGQQVLVERFVPEQVRTQPGTLQAAYEEFCAFYNAHAAEKTQPYDGIAQLLDDLHAAGVASCVITNKNHDAATGLLQHFFGTRFDLVVGRKEGVPPKPDITMVQMATQTLDVQPEDCVVLGDSDVDILCAQAAGCASCSALWGFHSREELAAFNPTHEADSPHDVLAIATGSQLN